MEFCPYRRASECAFVTDLLILLLTRGLWDMKSTQEIHVRS